MTDARLRGGWLGKILFDDLSDPAWRVFTSALMWCAEQGMDGRVPSRYLRQLHPSGEHAEAFAELVRVGIWKRTPEGYELNDWSGDLGQSTAEQVERYRANNRAKVARSRARAAERAKAHAEGNPAEEDPQVRTEESATGDETSDVTRYVGKGKGSGADKGVNENSGSVHSWPVRKPGVEEWVESAPGVFEEAS